MIGKMICKYIYNFGTIDEKERTSGEVLCKHIHKTRAFSIKMKNIRRKVLCNNIYIKLGHHR